MHRIELVITRRLPESEISDQDESSQHQDDHDHNRQVSKKNDHNEGRRIHQSLSFEIINEGLSLHINRCNNKCKRDDIEEFPEN